MSAHDEKHTWIDRLRDEFSHDPLVRMMIDRPYYGGFNVNIQGPHVVSANITRTVLSKSELERRAARKAEMSGYALPHDPADGDNN